MKVLWLTPQLPWPLDQGARIRNYYLLRAVAAAHTVDLLCLDADLPPRPPSLKGRGREMRPALPFPLGRGLGGRSAPLAALCRRVEQFPAPRRSRAERLRALARSPLPDLAWRAWQPLLAARLAALVARERYALVQVSSLEMMPYRHLLGRGDSRPPVVFDNLNAEHQLQRRAYLTDLTRPARLHAALYSLVQWRRLERYEARVCCEAAATLAVSDTDAAFLRAIAPAGRYTVLPNGVDAAAFAPRPPLAAPAPPTLLFTGTLDFRPNVDAVEWLVEAILPRLLRARPDLRCLIVGKAPGPRLRALARRWPALEVTGAVPDVRPYLARASVYVVPMRMGSGTRLKVLEAMAAGVPLVSTPLGLEGVDARAGEHALVADEAAAFASAVLALLADPPRAARLAAAARRLVEERYDWARLAPALLQLYAALGG